MLDSTARDFDPASKPFYKISELSELGFGDAKTIHAAIANKQIPVVRIGRKILVPTAWVRRTLQIDDPPLQLDDTRVV